MSLTIAIIGRSELLFNVATLLRREGYKIPLVITSKEAPEYKVSSEDFKKFAIENDAFFIHTSKINKPEIVAKIAAMQKIDLAVSINYSGIIEEEVIDLFEIGILNAHGGDLPRYRGNACQAWAIINGENRIGLCIHKMIGGELDSGDIIEKYFMPITIDTRIGEIWNWMNESIPVMMLDAIRKLSKNKHYTFEVQSKDEIDALRCYPRKPEDGCIDWTFSSIDVVRLVNASSEPYAGAFTFLEESKVIVWRAKLDVKYENYLAIPGQIASLNKDGSVTVICGKGKVIITEIQVDELRTNNVVSVVKSIRNRFKKSL